MIERLGITEGKLLVILLVTAALVWTSGLNRYFGRRNQDPEA